MQKMILTNCHINHQSIPNCNVVSKIEIGLELDLVAIVRVDCNCRWLLLCGDFTHRLSGMELTSSAWPFLCGNLCGKDLVALELCDPRTFVGAPNAFTVLRSPPLWGSVSHSNCTIV